MIIFLFLFLSVQLCQGCPEGHSEIHVPAVVGKDEGRLVKIAIDVVNGSGRIFTEINPLTGLSTQDSERTAIDVAFSFLNVSYDDCDVYFDVIGIGNSNYVDGPSAGAALTAGVLSAISGKKIREGIIITGTMSDNGKIGSVGGIVEKVSAAQELGFSYIVTHITEPKDIVLSSILEDKYGIRIISIDNVSQLYSILFSNRTIEDYDTMHKGIGLTHTTVPPGLPQQDVSGLDDFKLITISMIEEFNIEIKKTLAEMDNNTKVYPFIKYFDKEIPIQRTLINKGYLYTAANNMFRMSIDFNFIKALIEEKEIDAALEETKHCLNSYKTNTKKSDNWELVASSVMRRYWANSRVESTEDLIGRVKTDEEEYELLYSILQAKAWCAVAQYLNVKGHGTPIDERVLKDLADSKITAVSYMFTNSPSKEDEALWHLSLAEEEYNAGEYIASIYETCFAYALQKSHTDMLNKHRPQAIWDFNTTSKWGRLYKSQSLYMNSTDDDSDYMLLLISRCIDESYNEMKTLLNSSKQIHETEEEYVWWGDGSKMLVLRLLLAFQSIILIAIVIKGNNG